MPIAVFANKSFQTSSRKLYTFTEFTTESTLQTESQDVAGKKPSTYIKCPGLDPLSFSIPLDISFGNNIRKEYEDWKAIKDAGKAYSFILGNKPLGSNKWLLKGVGLANSNINKTGEITKATLQLKFEEYVRPGSASASNKSKTQKGISSEDNDTLNSTISSQDKAYQKRTNPNATAAVVRGYTK